jgi:hypothetical protein
MVVKLLALSTGSVLLPGEISGTHFCSRPSKPQGLVWLEGLGKLKEKSSDVEPATFRLVTQYSINHHLSQPKFCDCYIFYYFALHVSAPQTGHHQVLTDKIIEKRSSYWIFAPWIHRVAIYMVQLYVQPKYSWKPLCKKCDTKLNTS